MHYFPPNIFRVDPDRAGQRNCVRADVQGRRPAGLQPGGALQALRPSGESEERVSEHAQHPHQHHHTSVKEDGGVQALHQQLQVANNL